ncbi:MAG: hypothetical protein RMK57_15450 [Bryobacterales bacterium]|nr:hypothetical protein [Bryobacteraceae bacterium]MDW8355917.1 hypothetical protein [Bryobacterales bacterium]
MRAVWVLLVALPLAGQSWYPKHNITAGAGAGLPRGQLAGPLNNSGAVSVGYGYRWHRYFQADIGLDTVFRAARIRDFLPTRLGYLRISDYQFFLPFGGRAILPLASGRVLVSGGGGGAYLRYSERLSQPSDYIRVACPVCRSRSGWGYYALVGGRFALDAGRHLWVGATSKVYRGHTEGDPLGEVPGIRTQDRWVNVFGEFGLSF